MILGFRGLRLVILGGLLSPDLALGGCSHQTWLFTLDRVFVFRAYALLLDPRSFHEVVMELAKTWGAPEPPKAHDPKPFRMRSLCSIKTRQPLSSVRTAS